MSKRSDSPHKPDQPSLQAALVPAVQDLQRGDAGAALARLKPLLAQHRDHPVLLRLAGMAERMQGNLDAAIDYLRHATRLAPDDPLVTSSLGLSLVARGESAAGIAALQRAAELAPAQAAMWNNLGKALLDDGQVAAAVTPLQKAVERDPAMDPARFNLAYALRLTGEGEQAARQYRAVLANQPDDGEAWIGLAQLKSGVMGQTDMDALKSRLQRTALDPRDRIAMDFALADAAHDLEQYAEAFAAYQRANGGVRKLHPWDGEAASRRAQAVRASNWSLAAGESDPVRVVFVVGLPRSGTSLTEQILGCHSEVHAGGELAVLSKLIGNSALASRTPAEWKVLGRKYLAEALPADSNATVLTDKRPENWLLVGAALAMLPNARVVVCRRDRLETGFSCFRQRFSAGNQLFSYDFPSIARFWRDFDRTCRHWSECFPERVLEFDYDAMVQNPEPAIRRLLAFCRLDFEPACLAPERSERSVHTLSATQVRKPIRPSTPAAEHYGALLDPLRQAFLATDRQ